MERTRTGEVGIEEPRTEKIRQPRGEREDDARVSKVSKVRVLLGTLVVLVLAAFAAGCGPDSDQGQARQEATKNIEAKGQQARQTVKKKVEAKKQKAKKKVPLTDFHNHTGQYLDLGRRTPVIITKHGRPDLTIADASYFERIERIAAGQILAVLDLVAVDAADMSEEHVGLFEASRPTPEEIAADRWNDDAAS